MTDTKAEIARRTSALVGLDVSWVSHAADMLTIHFGPQKQYTTRRGRVIEGGAWALHVQCNWRIERTFDVLATQDDLSGSDEQAHDTANRLCALLVNQGPAIVEGVSVNEHAGLVVSFSRGLSLSVIPNGVEDDEDWRFFSPGVDAAHFVIEGGKIAPESFD